MLLPTTSSGANSGGRHEHMSMNGAFDEENIGEVSDILSHLAFSKPNRAATTDAGARAGACGCAVWVY